MLSTSPSDPPTPQTGGLILPRRKNGWIAKSLKSQRSGGFLWIGRIFPTALTCARVRARTCKNNINNPPNPPIFIKQSKKPLSNRAFLLGGLAEGPPVILPSLGGWCFQGNGAS
jgi:hypothetical protein